MNLDYNYRLQPASVKSIEWANRKLCSLAERIAEKYPDFFVYESKNPDRFPHSGHLRSKSAQSIMMTWTSTGLNLWPTACYLPREKMMNFNNYQLDEYFDTFPSSGIIKSSDDDIFIILPENYDNWQQLPKMPHTERILFIEHRMPMFIDKLMKDRMTADKMFKEREISEAAKKYE